MTFLSRCKATLCISLLLMTVSGSSLFSQEASDTPANGTSVTSPNASNNAIVIVLPGNGSTSGNGRAPQGSRVFNNSKYLITGTEMTTSGFSGPVGSVGWRWNAPRPTGAGAPAAQSVATTGNLKVFLKDTTSDATGLIGTFVDTNGVGYTKVIDATISITRTDTLEFTVDVPVGGPGTSSFTPTPGSGLLVIYVYNTTTPIATPLGAPTVFCTNVGSILTYQSQTANGTTGAASTFRPETRFGTAPVGGTATVTRRPNLFVPDNTPAGVSDTAIVSGIAGGLVVKRVSVSIDTLTHTYVGDFRMTLTHGATTRTLMNRPGTGTFGSGGDNFIGTVLVDSATRRIDSIAATGTPPNGPPFTGFFRPDSGGAPAIVSSSLAPFNGSDPNGMWIMLFADNEAQDTGRVRQWSLIIEYGVATGVGDPQSVLPNGFTLDQNYPNPFNPSTTIQFGLPVASNVSVKIYNLLGQEVATLVNEVKGAGTFRAVWNGRTSSGVQAASGMYFYSLVAKSVDSKTTFTNIKKMLLVK